MAANFLAIEARPAPVRTEGLLPWVRKNLFGNLPSAVVTLLMLGLLLWLCPKLFGWAVLHAVVAPNSDQCQAARGVGACWGVITEKHRLIIFGRYPFDQQWRPEVATTMLVALLMASCMRAFWKPWLGLLWLVVTSASLTTVDSGVLRSLSSKASMALVSTGPMYSSPT